jgi:ribose 5-phosphate isomerase B
VSRGAITEAAVRAAARAGTPLAVPAGTVVTPAARDLAPQLGVRLEPASTAPRRSGAAAAGARQATGAAPPAPPASRTARRVVALGADHGGVALKEHLKGVIGALGYEVLDLGTHGSEAVDYPDFAVAVARAVARGQAWRGIMVDGAGIGSAMAANKVPGVRAALCYDLTTATNAREHNDANLLTLGGTLIGSRLAAEIVTTFLRTDFGGGRHQQRVDKINALDETRPGA